MQNAVCEACLIGIVGDPDAGEMALANEAKDEFFDGLAIGSVEGGGRFVKEQEFRLIGECSDEGDALCLSAGEVSGVSGSVARQADFFQHGVDLVGVELEAVLCRAEGDIRGDGTGKKERALHD
jgi:hypothetical protein